MRNDFSLRVYDAEQREVIENIERFVGRRVMPEGRITEHFSWSEAECRHCRQLPPDLEPNVIATAEMAEKVRAHLGGQPMRILSWFRCPEHNAEVGGAKNSMHLQGKAIDFVLKDMPPKHVQVKVEELQREGIVGGLGSYSGFTHADTGPRRSWRGNY